MAKHKISAHAVWMTLFAVALVVGGVYAYRTLDLDFSGSEASGEAVTCAPSQQIVTSGSAVTFRVGAYSGPLPDGGRIQPVGPGPGVRPTRTPLPGRPPVFNWQASGGTPSSGTGSSFTTSFTNTGKYSITRNVILTAGRARAACRVTILGYGRSPTPPPPTLTPTSTPPSPSLTPTPSRTPTPTPTSSPCDKAGQFTTQAYCQGVCTSTASTCYFNTTTGCWTVPYGTYCQPTCDPYGQPNCWKM